LRDALVSFETDTTAGQFVHRFVDVVDHKVEHCIGSRLVVCLWVHPCLVATRKLNTGAPNTIGHH